MRIWCATGSTTTSCDSDEKVRQRRPEQLEAHDNETNDQERKMTKTQEINKKFPLWGAWAGAGLEVVAITLLMTFHIGSRALVLLGALFAVIVAVKRWNTIPEAKRIAWLVIPAVLAAALFGIYLYLRYDYLLAA
jgi:hypothetical protein